MRADVREAEMGTSTREWLEVLLRLHGSLAVSVTSDNLLAAAEALLEPDSGSVMLFDRKRRCLEVTSFLNLPEDVAERSVTRLGERVAGRVAQDRKPRLLVGPVSRYPEFGRAEGRDEIETSLCVPLVSESVVLGVLNLNRLSDSANPPYDDADLHAATLLGAHGTEALKNARLADTLLKQNRMLRQVDAARATVVSELVHEMRSALQAAGGYADNFLSGTFGSLVPGQKTKMERLKEQLDRLGRLLDEIRHTGRRELKREHVTLKKVVDSAVRSTEYVFEEHGISLQTEVPSGLEAYVDVGRMEQVLVNVLSNAAKYSGDGATVVIRAGRVEDRIEISVSDTGAGVPPEKLDRIFEEYYRLNEHASIPGSGLGLAIARKTVEAHGGRIWAEPGGTGGTVFKIEIPVR